MRTFSQTKEATDANWILIDAAGKPLGRVASVAASLIRGKHKPTFTPHIDGGDFVIIVNAEKVTLSGRKREQKTYYHHTGYIGGLKEIPFARMRSEDVLKKAVNGMLPKGRLGHKLRGKLRVYTGAEHPHAPQKPQEFDLAGAI